MKNEWACQFNSAHSLLNKDKFLSRYSVFVSYFIFQQKTEELTLALC